MIAASFSGVSADSAAKACGVLRRDKVKPARRSEAINVFITLILLRRTIIESLEVGVVTVRTDLYRPSSSFLAGEGEELNVELADLVGVFGLAEGFKILDEATDESLCFGHLVAAHGDSEAVDLSIGDVKLAN